MIELVTPHSVLDYALLPIELTNGNDGRGSKWFSSAKVRKQIEAALRATDHTRKQPHKPGVTLTITRILGPGQRLWDSDSIGRGNAKELVDALVACGWFVDDGPKWIVETRYRQQVDRDVGPATAITVSTPRVDVAVEL